MSFASTSAPSDRSRTITIRDSQASEGLGTATPLNNDPELPPTQLVGTLRLRGGRRPSRQHVAWDEGVVDNEGCGKKSSKICCIYHRPRKFDESSDEDSSESESDSPCDGGHHSHSRFRGQGPSGQGGGAVHELAEVNESNAYEVVPISNKGKRKAKGS